MPELNAGVLNLFLEQLSGALPAGVHAVLIWDGAGYPTRKDLKVPSNISLILLPPYSPELNPVENLWHYLRAHHWSNRAHQDYDELESEAAESLCTVCLDRDKVKSICNAEYVRNRALTFRDPYQKAIETKLAQRHLADGGVVLYDISSSYYEGETCPLARYGHDRDGKTGRPIIVYGVLTDGDGRPVAVQVYPGDTGDPATVPDQVAKLSRQFGLSRIVLVGDRGMLTQTQINTLKEHPGLGWISALRSEAIRDLLEDGHVNRSLFDQVNLAEIHAPDFPGERLFACYNPLLADKRRLKREALLTATEAKLTTLARAVSRRTKAPLSAAEIGVKAGRVIGRHKMAKHIRLTIGPGTFTWSRNDDSIKREELLDGIYVIRTSEPAERLSAADSVRTYKRLSQVEQAFRCLKGIDLLVRPIHHRLEPRVRAHVLICMLAYYVEWHLRRAWRPLLFADEELDRDRAVRDPVAAAVPSASVRRKKKTHQTTEGLPVHSFRTLLAHLGCRVRETCQVLSDPSGATFEQVTEMDPVQQEALRLLET